MVCVRGSRHVDGCCRRHIGILPALLTPPLCVRPSVEFELVVRPSVEFELVRDR